MFDTILVPLDGSQLSECALPYSVAVARSYNAKITLMHILERNPAGAQTQLLDLLSWQINKTKLSLYLEKIRSYLQELNVQARATVLEGLAADGITEYANDQGMKLIILSSHGHGGLTRWGISSVAQKIILSAPTSVLIVRAHHQDMRAANTPAYAACRRILVPLDGSQRAENVLPLITRLARYHESEIHLVQVVQTPEMARQMPPVHEDVDLSNRLVARNREEAGRYLEQLKSRSYLEGIAVQVHLISCDHAAAALHQLAEQEQIDLVALSAHGYSGNHQWPYGSMTNHFIMYGKSPLLVVQDLLSKQDPVSPGTSRGRSERPS